MLILGYVDRSIRVRGTPNEAATHTLHFGFPSIAPVSASQLLASTWSGHCLLIDVDTALADSQPSVASGYAGHTLRSPVTTGSTSPLFAVATTAAWAGTWRPGAAAAQRIENRFSACNAVALDPDGDLLAIGTGYYPLGSTYPQCAIELWTTGERPALLDWVRLPDVAVDRLHWDAESCTLFAWTGTITQDSGHLWRLELEPLRIIDAAPVAYHGRRCGERWGDYIVSIGAGSLELRALDNLSKVVRRSTLAADVNCAAVSGASNSLLLSTGELIDLDSFERSRLEALNGCTGIAALPTGDFAGINTEGVLRIWDRTSAVREHPPAAGQLDGPQAAAGEVVEQRAHHRAHAPADAVVMDPPGAAGIPRSHMARRVLICLFLIFLAYMAGL
jgi:hypothetical protein